MRGWCWILTCVAGWVAAGPEALAQRPAEEWDDRAVAKSVESGRRWLWGQWRDGHWKETYGQRGAYVDGPSGPNYGGVTSLCMYALLAAGESGQDQRVKQTLEWLAKVPIHGVYGRGMRANVWGMLGRNSRYRRHLAADVRWLIHSVYYRIKKYPDGTYPYLGPKPGTTNASRQDRSNWDNSNSQIAVLGVWAGARNGIEVPASYWRMVEKHWLGVQKGDGGWDYAKPARWKIKDPNRSYGAMTAAGLATLFVCLDALHGREFVNCRANTDTPAIAKGLKWMAENFSPDGNPGLRAGGVDTYYLYGVERVGLASGYKYFGTKDWYKLGAARLMRLQSANGSFADSLTETAFSLLFLARGRHPVLFNKLKYDGMWNCRPRDLANLTRWISASFESPVNWQIVNLDTPVAEWHDAPVLYISGAAAPRLQPADLDKLRRFVHQGGVIFSEAACNSPAFHKAMRGVYAKLFPDYELKSLPADHPIYSVHFKSVRGRLEGISNGVRLLAVHSPADVSKAWQLNLHTSQSNLFRLGANLYFYVTDRGSLRSRGTSPWPAERPLTPAATVRIVPVRHAGNWNPEPLALKRFAVLMGRRHRVKVELLPAAGLDGLDAAAVAVMTGTTSLQITDAERNGLRKYLAGGGTLVVDAAGGSDPFAAAMEKLLPDLLEQASWAPVPPDHALYAVPNGRIDKVRFRRALRAPGPAAGRLRGLTHKGRLAAIFSPDDLTAGLVGYACAGLKGYDPESAFALLRNAVVLAAGAKLPPPAGE